MKPNILPGLVCSSTEFFNHNGELKVIQNGNVKHFSELSFPAVRLLKEAIQADRAANQALHKMHPDSGMLRIEQFAKCRFGGLDFQGDIKDGILQDGEYWPCPKHGACAAEGILCKLPIVNGERLTKLDVQLIQRTITDKKNEVIADELNLPLGTFHKAKKYLHRKLGVGTKQEITLIASLHNLIWPTG